MCGIIAVLRRRGRRQPPSRAEIQGFLTAAETALREVADAPPAALIATTNAAARSLAAADKCLLGSAGITGLYRDPALAADVEETSGRVQARIAALENRMEGSLRLSTAELESLNAALIRLKDAAWALGHDRLATLRTVADLGGQDLADGAIEAYTSIVVALAALDRLEVRGRDSAGLQVLVTGCPEDVIGRVTAAAAPLRDRLQEGLANRLFAHRAVRRSADTLVFVYKAAAEIGELGDNTRHLRDAIRDDGLLRGVLTCHDAEAVVLGHTRWASVGIISQPNAHPINQEELDREGPYVAAVLNGDVDNYADLSRKEGLRIAPEITTDTKVIPALVSRRMAAGVEVGEAFRTTVNGFVGSVAIGCHAATAPDTLMLALRGSGQGVYVGLAEDSFIVASEPYGVVEETNRYIRLDGETPGNPDNPSGSQGQIMLLDRRYAGELEGMTRIAYDGTPLPVSERDVQTAEITTRDIDRGDHRHFLLKEVSEAPLSFHKTLRGKVLDDDGHLSVSLGQESLPAAVRENLRNRVYDRILVIGQGTAAVAGQGVAAAMEDAFASLGGALALHVTALPATELSGFHMRDDMSDTLVVAISQSGTTTDTNRTVDLVRSRGASVLAIVNRRNSDLTDKADGVLYTSDGRDVEMSVASTKAFYSQIAAGFLLAYAIRRELAGDNPAGSDAEQEILAALRELPEAMREVLALQDEIRQAAARHAPQRRYWAVVGNGKNRVAAEEIRIKLSELCYKSIACDATEDKKHIDLSCEPLILVCATGLSGSTAADVAKELAIYHAHKAAPILITSDDLTEYPGALEVIQTPQIHPNLAFVLSTMVGHLFGYHAALAIDALARPLRHIRATIEAVVAAAENDQGLLLALEPLTREPIATFHKVMQSHSYDGQLEASTAVRLWSHLGYVIGTKPLESYETETGKVGTPARVVEGLTEALTRAIEELTRPIDAIKHQAKTVTVGISRSDEALVAVPLVKAVLAAGAPRDRISYRSLRAIAALDPAVAEVLGSTRYRITGNGFRGAAGNGGHIEAGPAGSSSEEATIRIVERSGIAKDIASRVEQDPRLRGTKHLVATEREVLIARGRSDDRTVLLIPEVQAGRTTGITLLHVHFHSAIPAPAMHRVLDGYRNRYTALRDLVLETEPDFDETRLGTIPVLDLLTTPVHVLADQWRRSTAAG